MTAFARRETQRDDGSRFTCEMRSLNQRFLDLRLRLPEGFEHLEASLRGCLSKQLKRGKVECTLHYQPGPETAVRQINEATLDMLATLTQQLSDKVPALQPFSAAELLQWPGVLVKTTQEASDTMATTVNELCQATLNDLIAARQREGKELATFLNQQVSALTQQVHAALTHHPAALALYRQRLIDRLQEANVKLDPERLEQEMVLLAQKSDIKEEIERLTAHITEFKRCLTEGGVIGRRLDFLLQELNREANTLGAKAITTELSQTAVELKVLLEQAREQVQNIE